MTTNSKKVPAACDICKRELDDVFYDYKTHFGPWANACEPCYLHTRMFESLGVGKGQKYQRPDGNWATHWPKVAG